MYVFAKAILPSIITVRAIITKMRLNVRFGCVNMNFDDFISMGKQLYANTDEPIAIVDSTLKVVWANNAALKRYPTIILPDGMREFISNYDHDEIFSVLKLGKAFECEKRSEPLNRFKMRMVPVIADSDLIGCHVFFKGETDKDGTFPGGRSEEIIAAFSNEYKLPLTVIFSALGLMARHLDDSGGDDIIKAYMKLITQNSYRLLRLSNNLAEIAKFRSGLVKLNLKRGNLKTYINNICEACKLLTRSIDIELDCILPPDNIITVFDPDKLATAIINLIANSCKYTRDGNKITVKLEAHGEKAVITVSDKGAGINSNVIDRIFDPYFSFKSDGTMPGAGLGLSIVKNIVAQHNGTIALESKEGEGTRVALALPICDDESVPDYVEKKGADYLADRFSSLYVEMSDVCGCPLP